MNELHLFAGSGGGILGGILCGHTCVCAVELDEYCRKDLLQRQRDGILPKFPIWDDIRTFDGKPWCERVDIVAGGFPCKGISVAGSGTGLDHEESGLWREQARIISDVRPTFIFVENSPALTVRGGLRVLGDLAALGYDCRWGVISAADAIWSYGTPCFDHERARIWIVGSDGNSNIGRCEQPEAVEKFYNNKDWSRTSCEQRWNPVAGTFEPASETTSNANGVRKLQSQRSEHDVRGRSGNGGEKFAAARSYAKVIRIGAGFKEDGAEQYGHIACDFGFAIGTDPSADSSQQRLEGQRTQSCGTFQELNHVGNHSWWAAEPAVDRMAHGVANRVDRLKAIGNGQVPAVVKLAFDTLK